MADTPVIGQAGFADIASDFNGAAFLVEQMLAKTWTSMPVKVLSVQPGGVGPVGKVSIQPLVNQIDGQGNATPHGEIFNVPYFRMQGGPNAIIIDPQVGDLGMAIFASRDMSSVIANMGQANPGSFRRFDPADAIYQGGILNSTPTNYIQFSDDGQIITVVAPTKINFQAPTVAIQGDLTVSGSIVADGDVTGDGISLDTHVHSGVTGGDDDTGEPVA